jgi:hypothetical protein
VTVVTFIIHTTTHEGPSSISVPLDEMTCSIIDTSVLGHALARRFKRMYM